MKKIIVVLSIVLALALFVACATPAVTPVAPVEPAVQEPAKPADPVEPAAKTIKIAVSLPPANNAWQAKMLDDITAESKNYPDIEFTIKAAADDADQQNTLTTFKDGGFDVVAILPGDANLLDQICSEIYKAGIITVIIDRPLPSPNYTALVAGDNYACGVNAAHFLAEKLGKKGDIVVLRSYLGIPIDLARYNGFAETLAKDYPDMKIVREGDGEFNQEAGLKAMSDILPAVDHIDAVFSHDDESGLGALTAIKNAGRTDIRFITGMGGTKNAYAMLQANDPVYVASMSYFPSMGRDALIAAIKLAKGETVPKDTIIPTIAVTSANVAQYLGEAY